MLVLDIRLLDHLEHLVPMTLGIYTAKKCELDIHHIIQHALLNGHVTHADAEAFEPRCTVIRSRVPEIRYELGWPIENHQPHNRMAIYEIDFKKLSERACCAEGLIRLAAKDWVASGRTFGAVQHFLEFLGHGYRVLVPRGTIKIDDHNDPFGFLAWCDEQRELRKKGLLK